MAPGKFLTREKIFVFGTVFFVTAMVLLTGMFLFPTVRSFLHSSALATGLAPEGSVNDDAAVSVFFNDVDSNHPNAKAIAYLKEHHMITGYDDGTFKPDNLVTRAELLKLLFEAQKVYPSPAVYVGCFKDVKDQWFAPNICYAKAKGLVHGYEDKTFGPDKNISVADAFTVIVPAFNSKISVDAPPQDANEQEPLTRGHLAEILYGFLK